MTDYKQKINTLIGNLRTEMQWHFDEVYEHAYRKGYAAGYDRGYEDGLKDGDEDKQEQKQDAEIKVGDEVYSDAFDDKGIVTHITADKVACVCIICNGSTMMKVGTIGLHKTGRHFPQIAEVLAELRGAENDE